MALPLKEIYEKKVEYSAFYTGGSIFWTSDGLQLLCLCNGAIKVINIDSSSSILTIGETDDDHEEDPMYTFGVSHDGTTIVSAHKSGLLKLWDKCSGKSLKIWKSGHKAPVACLAFDITSENIASGGTDGTIRLWNVTHHTCTSSLKGAVGVFTVLSFYPYGNQILVFGAADDAKIRSWNSKTGEECLIYSGHFSKVTTLQFTLDGEYMVSSGRDRVIILWNLKEGKALKTLPIYESIESIVLLPSSFAIPNFKKKIETEGIYVASAGEKGVIKIWDVLKSRLMFEQTNSLVSPTASDGGLAITHLFYNNSHNAFCVVTADHNIIIHDMETFQCLKQMIGFTDEILDVLFIGNDMHIIVATNSPDLKYYELQSMNCEILKGHSDIVLSLAKFTSKPELFVSSSKDNSVRLWLQTTNKNINCVGVGSRHTASVGSVFTTQSCIKYFASVSQDNCLKLWNIPNDLTELNQKIKSSCTELAHQSDINCVCVSPNDEMIATASQDKTIKLWSETLSLLGVFKGHKRGVWCVRFSPIDQVLLSCSADCSIKLWSLSDLNCLKTFEGHDSSVLKVEFLSRGMQVISCGADGLLKLWNIKTSECKMSLDNHDGKVWSMAVTKDESTIITGASDSKLVKWLDVTTERKEKMLKEREELVLQEQQLVNFLHDKKIIKALKLALRLERPMHVLKIINEILKNDNYKLAETILEINNTQKETLLRFALEWNTNNKTCHVAQNIINVLTPEIISGKLIIPNMSGFLQGALPYSERHFERLTNLLQDLNFLSYTVNCMQPHTVSQ